MHQSVRKRVFGMKKLSNMMCDLHDVRDVAEPLTVEPPTVVSDVGTPKNNVNRIGKCGRKRKEDGELPSNKLKKSTRGASSFLEYQALVKAETTTSSICIRDENFSYRLAGKSMQAALTEHGVSLGLHSFRDYVKKASDNGCVGLEPQRNGGQALPSNSEKNIADSVKHFREKKVSCVPRRRFNVGSRSNRGDSFRVILPGRQANSWMVQRVAGPNGISDMTPKAFETDKGIMVYRRKSEGIFRRVERCAFRRRRRRSQPRL
jgi:hypothetical protein